MTWYLNAIRHDIPPGPNDPPIKPRIIVLHVMEGSIQSADKRFRNGEGIEAHFGFPKTGEPWQWRDTDFQADAQATGNDYCISFETEGFATEKLNRNQISWILEVGAWLSGWYEIPARIVVATSERGWGYHRQFPSWNPNNHSCPGDIRLKQLETVIIPTLLGGDMTTIDDAIKTINDHADDLYRLTARAELPTGGTDGRASLMSLNARLTILESLIRTGVSINLTDAQLADLASKITTELATRALKLSGTMTGNINLGADA